MIADVLATPRNVLNVLLSNSKADLVSVQFSTGTLAWQDMFHDIFSGGAAQGEGAETFYKESTADKLKKQMERSRKNSQKLRLKLATKVCEPRWMPETVGSRGKICRVSAFQHTSVWS